MRRSYYSKVSRKAYDNKEMGSLIASMFQERRIHNDKAPVTLHSHEAAVLFSTRM